MSTSKDACSKFVEQGAQETEYSLAQVTGASDAERAFFLEFASWDAEQVAEHDKRLVRRIDMHLFPCLIVMYFLNILDRSNLAQARQGNLERDLGMLGTDFNLATSIFFVGYLLMQLPSNVVLTRLRPSMYLASCNALWGVISTCNAATRNFTQLLAVRFFLGFVEAPFFPGAMLLMSSWYTRAELTRRVAWLYTGLSLANMFSGLIAYAVLKDLDGTCGIAGWRWLFIVTGVSTIGVGISSVFILPNYPRTTRWLSAKERAFASWRLLADIREADDGKSTRPWQGVKLALKDYRLYLFVLQVHMCALSQTFANFFPSIVQTLGYDSLTTLLLTAPVWFATFLTSILVNWTAAWTRDRSIHIFCLMVIAAIGNAILTGTTATGARYFAMFLMPMGAVSAQTINTGWVANSFPRPLVKRSAAIAIVNMIANTATIYGSYMYNKAQAPQYIPGGIAAAIVSILVALLAIVLRYLHQWENKRLDEAEDQGPEATTPAEGRLGGFRYIY